MTPNEDGLSIHELSLTSKYNQYQEPNTPSSSLSQSNRQYTNSIIKNQNGTQMSDFSWIIQEGLQKARRQSEQQRKRCQIVTVYTRNIDEMMQQTTEMHNLVKMRILQLQQEEIYENIGRLGRDLQQMKGKIAEQNKRKISNIYSHRRTSSRKKSELAYYVSKQKLGSGDSKQIVIRRSISSHRRKGSIQSFRSVQNKNRQKQLLLNRIAIIKESIEMTTQTNQQKQEKLYRQNKLLKEQIRMMIHDIGDYKIKSLKKQNIYSLANQDNGHKNLKYKDKYFGLRKSSLFGRKRSQANFKLSNNSSTKKVRIRSSCEKEEKKLTHTRQCTARDQYFEKNKIKNRMPHVYENAHIIKTQYY